MERSWLRSGVLNADCTVISLIWVLWHALGVYGMERVVPYRRKEKYSKWEFAK